jgi:hypothetical protein
MSGWGEGRDGDGKIKRPEGLSTPVYYTAEIEDKRPPKVKRERMESVILISAAEKEMEPRRYLLSDFIAPYLPHS